MKSLYPQRSDADLIRRLAIASIAGQAIWVLIVVIGGLIEPGYSEVRDAVSVLGARNATHPWLFDIGVAIWGISFILAAVALVLDGPRGLRGWLGPGLIAFTGLAQILDGFPFPADCQKTIEAACYARDVAGELSWRDAAHGWIFFLGAVALELSVFAIAWRMHGDKRWGRFDLFALFAGIAGLLIFCGLSLISNNEPGGHYGLVQRLALAAGGLWVLILTAGLLIVRRD
jgi:hypothetical protein